MNGNLVIVPVGGIRTTEGSNDSDDRLVLKQKNTSLPCRHGHKRPLSVRELAFQQMLEEQESNDEHNS